MDTSYQIADDFINTVASKQTNSETLDSYIKILNDFKPVETNAASGTSNKGSQNGNDSQKLETLINTVQSLCESVKTMSKSIIDGFQESSIKTDFLKDMMDRNANEIKLLREENAREMAKLKSNYEEKIKKLLIENKSTAQKLDELDQKNRNDFTIISGPSLGIGPHTSSHDLDNIVVSKINEELGVGMSSDSVLSARPLGTDKKKILVKFINKHKVLRAVQRKKLEAKNSSRRQPAPKLFLNEFLTPLRSSLFYHLRMMKKRFPQRIFSVFTREGDVFYKIQETDRPVKVSAMEQLETLISQLGVQYSLD